MSDIFEVKIIGLDEIQKQLEEILPNEARLALRIALSAGGGTVKDAMQADCPVEEEGENSGFLRDHLKVKTVIKRDGLSGVAIVGATQDVYPGHEGKPGQVNFKTVTGRVVSFFSRHAGQVTASKVARYLEFGTSRMPKHPFITMAWESSRQAAMDRIIEKLKAITQKKS